MATRPDLSDTLVRLAEIIQAKDARIAQFEAELKAVEFPYVHSLGYSICPFIGCNQTKEQGHTDSCTTGIALRGEE